MRESFTASLTYNLGKMFPAFKAAGNTTAATLPLATLNDGGKPLIEAAYQINKSLWAMGRQSVALFWSVIYFV